jgi:hypothetical protein
VRPRDPRKLLPGNRPLPANVKIAHVPEQGYRDDGSVTTRQEAEVTVPCVELERLWNVENLENLARTYWAFLIRISRGLLKIRYSPDSREIVALGFIVLLRFHKPDYEIQSDGGCVTWRIHKGFLVAPGGRNKGHLRICVKRPQDPGGDDQETVRVTSEVGAFVPMLTFPGLRAVSGFGRWLYRQTQLRVHVIVTHAFLRSLGNLELERSQVGALRLAPPGQPTETEPIA